MVAVLIGFVLATLLAVPQLVRSYRLRDQPEPPNRRSKLPALLAVLAGCVACGVSGTEIVLASIFGVIAAVEISLILSGRSPWWMQSRHDRRESFGPAYPNESVIQRLRRRV